VLTSTSIGQEGLDFHNYCRRIVHWNLPSNPIDLEQREGRINRFECLAIRQNVAKRYGDIQYRENVWDELFQEAALREKSENSSDLIPYWGLKETEDMIRIERIVPMYPYSRDQAAYDRLIKILSLYRLTLGQARQEELLEYLIQNDKKQEDLTNLFMNLSPYFKKHNSTTGGE
ncbi:MAG: helicase-related protein, partial [Lachnospiraceae bacterium]